jgi:hypothetical protein
MDSDLLHHRSEGPGRAIQIYSLVLGEGGSKMDDDPPGEAGAIRRGIGF